VEAGAGPDLILQAWEKKGQTVKGRRERDSLKDTWRDGKQMKIKFSPEWNCSEDV